MVSVDHPRAEELAKGIDGNNNNGDGVLVRGGTPLEQVISTSKKRGDSRDDALGNH